MTTTLPSQGDIETRRCLRLYANIFKDGGHEGSSYEIER
jgi:hypothetical protein